MKLGSRRNKYGKKKGLIIFVTFTLFLSIVAAILYSTYWIKKPLFISPIGSNSQNLTKKLEKLLLDYGIEFSSITSRFNSSYMVRLKEDGEAVLTLEKDFKKQIASLQAVLKQLTIEGKRVIRIDFRFDKPVVEIRE